MTYEHAFEYAFYHYRPEYLSTGKKNPSAYTITATTKSGDYFRRYADSKQDIIDVMSEIKKSCVVDDASLAMQNDIGQLMWTREFGWTDDIAHPKYMDMMACFN